MQENHTQTVAGHKKNKNGQCGSSLMPNVKFINAVFQSYLKGISILWYENIRSLHIFSHEGVIKEPEKQQIKPDVRNVSIKSGKKTPTIWNTKDFNIPFTHFTLIYQYAVFCSS